MTLHELIQIDRLRRLSVTGWRFRPHFDERGLTLLMYWQDRGEWVDVVRVRSATDAQAGRFLASSLAEKRPHASWITEGALDDVLNALDRFLS
jgi:hypothetical protein